MPKKNPVSKELEFAGLIAILILLICVAWINLNPTTSVILALIGFIIVYFLAGKFLERGKK